LNKQQLQLSLFFVFIFVYFHKYSLESLITRARADREYKEEKRVKIDGEFLFFFPAKRLGKD